MSFLACLGPRSEMDIDPKLMGVVVALGAIALLARRASARAWGGLVLGGRSPRPSQSYLFQRTDTHKHQGIDIEAPYGAEVYSSGPGTVAALWPDGHVSGYGTTAVIQHFDGTQTLYAHMDDFALGLSRGDTVERGTNLGFVGTSQAPNPPMKSSPHLHFEAHHGHTLAIREGNPPRFEPMAYLHQRRVRLSA